ncbi:hypothetical protein [Brevibacillus panacihumi]|uniref:hypothetical protein n=1 Tax=Brevibacillus panacihumi TaxID=497735 RepID=UPI003D256C36
MHLIFKTKEVIDIGDGVTTFPLLDGNVMLVTHDNKFHYFDFGTKTAQEVHAPQLKEDEELGNFTVSKDGNAIAYYVSNKDKKTVLHLYRKS